MENIVMLGGGGHCKSVIDAALRSKKFGKIYITDVNLKPGDNIFGCEVAGTDDVLPKLLADGVKNAFITVGFVKPSGLRSKLFFMAKDIGFSFPNIIDPSAVVSEHATLGTGIFVGKNAVINAGARIGDNVIINTGAIVDHDSVVGDFAHIAVGTKVCGEAKIGANALIGAGATVLQGVKIGNDAIIGAGSVALKDIGASCTAVGAPARILRRWN
ncbi:acetyltransferase [Butyrivibrio sp. VCD2006]|uniref:acetyltransferase n=1 Tax=Butyrivibrio sp. VCD2006 TaxID=1280664 RepID=UPI0004039F07|nr:acetyltransferase [Butyrivibrio sp. VCD2006]